MTSESALWSTTRRHLAKYGKLERIESPLVKGIPDVCYCLLGHTGWLELKELDAWPARSTTSVRIPSLQLEQVLFMEGWCRARGTAHLLLQVKRAYLLVDHVLTRKIFERSVSRTELELSSVVRGEGKFPAREVVKALTR